jgi:hypothetical protein
MSGTLVYIDHIALTLFGVSSVEAQGAADAFAALLRERLAGWRPDVAGAAPVELGHLDLGSVDIGDRLDAPTLATLLADRLVAQLDGALAAPAAKQESA